MIADVGVSLVDLTKDGCKGHGGNKVRVAETLPKNFSYLLQSKSVNTVHYARPIKRFWKKRVRLTINFSIWNSAAVAATCEV